MTPPAHRQSAYALCFEWGLVGAREVAPGCDIAVVVDVLSFTTTVTVAVERGTRVYPYRWRDESAERFATDGGVRRRRAQPRQCLTRVLQRS